VIPTEPLFAEGWFASRHAKTAHGLLRYGRGKRFWLFFAHVESAGGP
jgi:hypothetical protein